MSADLTALCSCGDRYPATGDNNGGWTWPDGLTAPAAHCKPCSRRRAETKRASDELYVAEVREWAAGTLTGRQRSDVERYAASLLDTRAVVFPFPRVPGYPVFRAWREQRLVEASPPFCLDPVGQGDVSVASTPPEAQKPSERGVRRRRSDVAS